MKTQKDINRKLVLSDKQIDVAVQRIIKKKKKYGTDIITTIINGEIITAVKYRKLIDLERLSPSSRRKITKRYILKAFGGRGIKTTDGKTITVKSTGGADKMNFQSKHKISLYIDDLIRIGVLQSDGPDYQTIIFIGSTTILILLLKTRCIMGVSTSKKRTTNIIFTI